jgi:hypothetical protein
MTATGSAERRFGITFEGLSAAEANKAGLSLESALLDLGLPDVKVHLQKASENTQDFGATLVVALGTGASVAVAKGIGDWLRRRADAASIVIVEMGENRVVARGPAAQGIDAAAVARAFAQAAAPRSGD